MIKQDFFEAEIEYDQQQDQSYDYILTKELAPYNSTDYTTYQEVDTATYPGAYYLGWMKYENIPTSFLLSGATVDSENSIMTTTTPVDNYNIGYIARYSDSDSLAEYKIASTSMVADGKWKTCIGNTSGYTDSGCNFWQTYRFPNRFNVGCINYAYLHVCYALINMEDQTAAPIYFQMDVNAEDFEDWITGTYEITLPGTETTFELLNGTINENYFQQVEIGGVGYRVVIFSYQCFADRPVDRSGDTFAYLSLSPNINLIGSGVEPTVEGAVAQSEEINTSCTGAYYYTLNGTGVNEYLIGQGRRTNSIGVLSSNGQYYPANTIYDYPNWDSYVILPNGYDGTFSKTEIALFRRGYLWGDNCFMWCDGSNTAILVRMYKTSDIIHHASILPRWKGKSTDPATHGLNFDPEEVSVYYPEVLETNEFTGRLVTGTPEELEEILRPWQFDPDDWENEPYGPDDKPPYVPPGPEPGPTPEGTEPKFPGDPTKGSRQFQFPPTGVQLFALTNSQIDDFRNRLWQQPKSFYEAVQIAGKQTTSIFNYISSFRYYPFSNPISHDEPAVVKMGTGAIFKENDGITNYKLPICNNRVSIQTCGTWDLNDSMFHWRGNFLDYNPYLKFSIYLPFVGTFELDTNAIASHNDISSEKLTLELGIDYVSGTGTYFLYNSANVLLLTKSFKAGIDLPLNGNDAISQSTSIMQAGFNTATTLLGAAATIAGAAGAIGANISATPSTGKVNLSKTPKFNWDQLDVASTGLNAASDLVGSLGSTYVQNCIANRPVPVNVSGAGGILSNLFAGQIPYITVYRQKYDNPTNYGHATGYLIEKTKKIGDIKSGFTRCHNVDVSGIDTATEKEKAQIKSLLESGFYV